MLKTSVLGAGSWGTALATLLAKKGQVLLYARDPELVSAINKEHRNSKYFPSIPLSNNIHATTDIEEAVCEAEVIVNAVPTQSVRSFYTPIATLFRESKIIVNSAKGIEQDTQLELSGVFEEIMPPHEFAALSGPSHAEEVIVGMPTAVVVASENSEIALRVQQLFMDDTFRVYTSEDLVGVELGGALKNILAVGIGIAHGLGYGDNSKAALMTRGIHEIIRYAKVFGAKTSTLYGLSGLGDIIVTCSSEHSRNRRAGVLIGKGQTVEEATENVHMVVEGIPTTKAAFLTSRTFGFEMPITEVIHGILYEGFDIEQAAETLMLRAEKSEYE